MLSIARHPDVLTPTSAAPPGRATRRRILGFAAAGVGTVLVAACGGAPASPTTAPAPTTASATTSAPAPTTAPVATTAAAPATAAAPTVAPATTVAPASTSAAATAPVATVATATGASPTTAAASPSAASTANIKMGGRFILGTPQPIQTLDPHKPSLANNFNLYPGMYNALTRFDDQMNPVPELAESWDMTPDGLSYTFKLRQGVKFHNGRAMTSDDVKFSLDRIRAKETASTFASNFAEVDHVETPDPNTVKVVMASPSAILLAALVDAKIVAKENEPDLANKAVGTGPYKLNSYTVNDQVVLDKNPNYWDKGKPYMDGVTIKTLADPNALFTALTTGNVDAFWQLPSKFVTQLQGATDQKVLQPDKSAVTTLFMVDWASQPFNDPRARQALQYIMDKPTMLQVAYFGLGSPALTNNLLPAGHWAEKADLPQFPYDPKKAKDLFDAVGVKQLRFAAPAINPEWKPISEVLDASFRQIGIQLKIDLLEVNEWLKVPYPAGTKYPNTITTNIFTPGWDPAFIWRPAGPGPTSGFNYDNPQVDKLLLAGRASTDQAKRKDIYGQIQDIWSKDLPLAIICQWKWSHGATSRVQNLKVLYNGQLQYQETWLSK